MKQYKADLHIHTTASDGSYTYKQIIDESIQRGLEVIAITDHDTVDAIEGAIEYAKGKSITVIPGIEFSSEGIYSVHILGYGIDILNKRLKNKINRLVEDRQTRQLKMIKNLSNLGIELNYKIKNTSGSIGRMHLARKLVEQGYSKDINEAFDKYLNEKGLAYEPHGEKLYPFEAVELIKNAGGMPVIAHPLNIYRRGNNALDYLIEGLQSYGLKGLEVYYAKHSQSDIGVLKTIAKRYNLYMTGGSDFHGEASRTKLGDGNLKINEEFLKEVTHRG